MNSYIEEARAVISDIEAENLAVYDDQPAVLWGILNALVGIHEDMTQPGNVKLNTGIVVTEFKDKLARLLGAY